MIAGTVSILVFFFRYLHIAKVNFMFQLIQYAIMIFCGTSMHLQMNEKLKNFSDVHQRLQKQFFKTLLLQIGVPTVLFHMPIFPVLLAPFFNFKFSYQTGIIYSLFCSYPPIDALIIMTVVSDYRSALTSKFQYVSKNLIMGLRTIRRKSSTSGNNNRENGSGNYN